MKVILVVEDNKDLLSFISRTLSIYYNIKTANNGDEALKVLETEHIDIIISDLMMPIMDGKELCISIKNNLNYSHIPFILLTAKTNMEAKLEGVNAGADLYMEKPFSFDYLLACINNILMNRDILHHAFKNSPYVTSATVSLNKLDDNFLMKLHEVVTENMQDPEFGLDEMAENLCLSRSTLNRKIKSVLNMTPNDYIRLERLKRAASLLKEDYKINEVCYMVGFNSPSYFTRCFRAQFGILPKEVLKEG